MALIILLLYSHQFDLDALSRSIGLVPKMSLDEYNNAKSRATREEVEKLENSPAYVSYMEGNGIDGYRTDLKKIR
jgi:ABC-type lipoprotein release transport system permease subunit